MHDSPKASRRRKLQSPTPEETFTYSHLPGSLRADIEGQTRAIRELLERNTRNVIQVGLRLQYVRNQIGRDGFQKWLRSEFFWSQPVASNYMAAARAFSEEECIGQFQTSALFVLARRNVPTRAREEAVRRARNGEWITKSVAQAIVLRYQDGKSELTSKAVRRVRKYVENMIKQIPKDIANEVISEIFSIAEEMRRRMG